MARQPVELEIADLREQIREHDRRYYFLAAPTIFDREYDRLMAGSRTETAHLDFIASDRPTQRVGGEPIATSPCRAYPLSD